MQWWTIFLKENVEASRNFKWIWVPLVFILLCITDPLSTYYLPQILEATGGLPDGAVIEIPTPSAAEVFQLSLGQMNTIGVLLVALVTMGTISGEKKNGVAELILVKPVSHLHYVTAKWAASLLLVTVSLGLGLLASWYYVNLLFGDISIESLGVTFVFYTIWYGFILAISLFMNTWSRNPGIVLFYTMATVIILSIASGMLSHIVAWSPAQLQSYIGTYLMNGEIPEDLWGATILTVGVSIVLLGAGTYLLKKNELSP